VSGGQFSLNDMVDIFREVGAESKEDIEKALNTDHF
jgi:hypothetical protein